MSDFPGDDATDPAAPANPPKGGGRNLSLRRKSAARMAAVQCLYQVHMNPEIAFDAQGLSRQYREQWAHGEHLGDKGMGDLEPDYAYLGKLLAGLRDTRELIAPLRARLLESAWNKHRLPPLLEALLDTALFELHAGKLGAKLLIDEYMHIAARFFDEKDIGFVNGILHGAAQQIGLLPKADASGTRPATDPSLPD